MPEFVRSAWRRSAVIIAFLALAWLSNYIRWRTAHEGQFGNDFGVYWRVANNPLGEAYFWTGQFPFPYAPTMLAWIQPLTLIPEKPAFFGFVALSIAAFIWACRRHLSFPAIALCVVSPPFMRALFTGQVTLAITAAMLWACSTANRMGAGIAFGLIASVKPQLVLMAPLMMAMNKDWRAFTAAASTFLVSVAASVVFFGPERWPEWLASLNHFRFVLVDTNIVYLGLTPAMYADRVGVNPLPFMLCGIAAGAALVYFCRNSEPLEKTAAIAAGSLLAAPYALVYDLLPVVLFLAMSVTRGNLLSGFAMLGMYNPLPLLIGAGSLFGYERGKAAVGGAKPVSDAYAATLQTRTSSM